MSVLGRSQAVTAAPFEVGEVLRRVADGLQPQLQAAGVRLAVEVEREPVVMNADATGFEQVVTNLVVNAMQATPPGGSVGVRVVEGPEGLVLTVDDEGPGIPPEERVRIFEPFWTTKRAGEGTGLGLAVVDAIVHAHGGRIEVEQTDGGGASLRVTWPRLPPGTLKGEVLEPDAAAAPAGTVSSGSRLLVIDDEPAVRATIARHARAQGWSVVELSSAIEALDYLFGDGGSCDAIVCDLRMPGLSGAEFHDEVARRSPAILARTLFLTGDLRSQEATTFAQRCQSPILAKPFDANDLLRRLVELSRAG
jgi:CheY-like chemotaxis protein